MSWAVTRDFAAEIARGAGSPRRPVPKILATRLAGLRVAVDVQHLYRKSHPRDRGACFTLAGGFKVDEAEAATRYALALTAWLAARGADVLTNASPALRGEYPERNEVAKHWGAHVYLACHLNAGRGSYARLEYIAGAAAVPLAQAIEAELVADFPEILSANLVALSPGQRGAVCIEEFRRDRPALILEPFFGDNPRMQGLMTTARLLAIGEAIGAGVAKWWEQRG